MWCSTDYRVSVVCPTAPFRPPTVNQSIVGVTVATFLLEKSIGFHDSGPLLAPFNPPLPLYIDAIAVFGRQLLFRPATLDSLVKRRLLLHLLVSQLEPLEAIDWLVLLFSRMRTMYLVVVFFFLSFFLFFFGFFVYFFEMWEDNDPPNCFYSCSLNRISFKVSVVLFWFVRSFMCVSLLCVNHDIELIE